MMKRAIFAITLLLILFPIISASVTCTPNSVSKSYYQGNSTSSIITCVNNGNESVTVTKTGSFFIIDQSIIGPSPSSKAITIEFDSNTNPGSYSGTIDFSDTSSVSISAIISSIPIPQQAILIFPTSKVVTVKQGEEKTQNILITVPSTYPSSITIQSVDFNPGTETIKFGDLNLGLINPGNTIQIPIIFSGVDASTGTYQTNLNIFAINSSGQILLPPINLQLQVTSGITPITNFSFTQLPSCSLSATELQLNATYSLICTRNNANIEIVPTLDSNYIQGVSVDETSTQYIYNFKPKKVGQTTFLAYFTYKNAPLGDPFTQSIKVQQGLISGSYIDVVFYQKGNPVDLSNLKTGETIIQVIENVSKSLISNYQLYLSGILVNNTINLEAKSYELRALSPGYMDKIVSINITNLPLSLSISPVKSSYLVGETINITSESGVSYLLDEILISNPYSFVSSGNKTLKAIKEGYASANLTLLVIDKISYKSASPLIEEWKKGKNVLLELTDTASWNVEFSELKNDAYLTAVSIKTGEGKLVEFKIDKPGNYIIKSGDQIVLTKSIENSGFLDFTKGWKWYVLVIIVVAIFGILWYFVREKEEGQNNVSFDMSPRQ